MISFFLRFVWIIQESSSSMMHLIGVCGAKYQNKSLQMVISASTHGARGSSPPYKGRKWCGRSSMRSRGWAFSPARCSSGGAAAFRAFFFFFACVRQTTANAPTPSRACSRGHMCPRHGCQTPRQSARIYLTVTSSPSPPRFTRRLVDVPPAPPARFISQHPCSWMERRMEGEEEEEEEQRGGSLWSEEM